MLTDEEVREWKQLLDKLSRKVNSGIIPLANAKTAINRLNARFPDKNEIIPGRGKKVSHIVNFESPPWAPIVKSLVLEEDQLPGRVRGELDLDLPENRTRLKLFKSGRGALVTGEELKEELVLAKLQVPGAQLLDFYLSNQELIPEEFLGKKIFFLGTIYRVGGELTIRYIQLTGKNWDWRSFWLGHRLRPSYDQVLILENNTPLPAPSSTNDGIPGNGGFCKYL